MREKRGKGAMTSINYESLEGINYISLASGNPIQYESRGGQCCWFSHLLPLFWYIIGPKLE